MYDLLIINIINTRSHFQFSVKWQKNKYTNSTVDDWYGFGIEDFTPQRISDLVFFNKIVKQIYKWNWADRTPERVIKRLEKLNAKAASKETLNQQ